MSVHEQAQQVAVVFTFVGFDYKNIVQQPVRKVKYRANQYPVEGGEKVCY